MAELSPFLKNCAAFIKENALNVIRVSEAYGNGEINTVELMPVSPCQDVYSVAKTFTMTGVGLLYDKGLLRLDEKVCDILKKEMEAAADLKVDLIADLHTGNDWYEAK